MADRRSRLVAALSLVPRVGFALAVVALIGLVLVVLIEVVARRVLNAPTLWAFDMARYLHAGAFLLAAGELLRRREHITVDVFVRGLSNRLRAAIELIAALVLTVASGWAAFVSAQQTYLAWRSGQVDWVSVWAPLLWPYYAAITFALLALFLASLTWIALSAHTVIAPHEKT